MVRHMATFSGNGCGGGGQFYKFYELENLKYIFKTTTKY